MDSEWDEAKRRANREKHGLDFSLAEAFDWETAQSNRIFDGNMESPGSLPSDGSQTACMSWCSHEELLSSGSLDFERPTAGRWRDMKKRKPDDISQEDWDAVDIPELTEEDFARMRPASEVVPEIVEAYRRSRGRPPKEVTKVAMTVRFDADIVEAFRAKGRGWQTRMNDALRTWLREHPTT